MSALVTHEAVGAAELAEVVRVRVRSGERFAALMASARDDGSTVLWAVTATRHGWTVTPATVAPHERHYPSLTLVLPSAGWYEREIHDLFGLVPDGHPRLDPLVLPVAELEPRPRPGGASPIGPLEPTITQLPGQVTGEGVFTIPYGPVRSGVFESVEYLVETSGEEIHHLRIRVYHKHRGLDQRFVGLNATDAVLLAERVEGTCSVAHAVAFSRSIESLAHVTVPRGAELVRVLHAELERVAVHLDSVVRHTEAAGQAVAYARLSRHKEEILRLRAQLCGSRFGRGVVVPGGVTEAPLIEAAGAARVADALRAAIRDDARALMATPSFLDRLRGTGPLTAETIHGRGVVGPVARACGAVEDTRVSRPYGAYQDLSVATATMFDAGDALERQRVRLYEIDAALDLVGQVLAELAVRRIASWRVPVTLTDGLALAGVEAPQGELLYLVEVRDGKLARVKPRTASFHNLSVMPRAFRGDIFTDFAFIEASFGLSIAGVSG